MWHFRAPILDDQRFRLVNILDNEFLASGPTNNTKMEASYILD